MIDFEEEDDVDEVVASNKKEVSLWVSKYRPQSLEHFCLDSNLKSRFQTQIEKNDIQNCSLIGSQGIGKTTLALILAKASEENDILFIPCAIEGKVETIQSKIIPFCQSASKGKKIIILDELDSASATQANSFQKSLRNSIELFSDCSWIATANYQSNIIPPVLSRLPPISLRFSVSDMISNLLYILGEEKVKIVSEATKTKQFLGSLIKSYFPDMRSVIGQLQASCIGGELNVDEIVVNNKESIRIALEGLVNVIKSNKTPLEIRKTLNSKVIEFGNNGNLAKLCSPYGLGEELLNYVIENMDIGIENTIYLIENLNRIEKSIDGETQLFGFILKLKNSI